MQRKILLFFFSILLLIGALAVRADATGTNLLSDANPGFEDVSALQYWVAGDPAAAISRSSALVHSGSYSCVFSTPTSSFDNYVMFSATVPVTAGHKYSIRSWCAVAENSPGFVSDTEIRVRIAWINASGIVISTGGHSSGQVLDVFDTWQMLEVSSITAPAGSVAARLVLDCQAVVDNDNPVYADDTEIEDIQVMSPAGFAGQVMTPTVIDWSWLPVFGVDGYQIVTATGGALSGNLLPNVTYWTEQGLQSNAMYSRNVKSYIGGESSSTITASIFTPSQIPTPPLVTAISSTSFLVQLNTDSNSNNTTYSIKALSGNTTYYVQTDGSFGASVVYRSTMAWGAAVTVKNLSVNSLYKFFANSRDSLSNVTAYSAAVSSYTLAAVPGTPAVFGVIASSFTISLVPNNNNPELTEYAIHISSANGTWARYLNADGTFSTAPVYATTTSWTNISGAIGLTPNTTFTIETVARNFDNVSSAFSPSFIVATLAMPPVFDNLVQQPYELQISWTNNQNPIDTLYTIEDTTLNVSSATRGLSWIESGLISNTTHSFRVKAANRAGIYTAWVALPNGCTLVEQPNKPWVFNIGVTSTTIRINTGNNSSFTEYAVRVSSPGWTRYLSGGNGEPLSDTAVYLTTATWSGTGTIWVNNLSTNTVYSYTVGGKGGSNQTSFDYTSSTATLAVTPAASVITAVNISSVTLSWEAASNPSWTRYEVTYSSNNFVSNISTSASLASGLKALTTSVIALNPDTTFWFRIRAYNEDGIATGYATAISSSTLSMIPSLAGMQISSDSIRVTWGANGNPFWTQYVAENIVAGSSNPAQTPLFWQETGLTPNTTYQYRVKSVNSGGVSSSWAALWSTSTLAAVPLTPAVSGVAISSVNYRINVDVNPGWTEYGVRISSNNGSWIQYVRTDGTFGATAVYASTTSWSASPWVRNLVANTAYRLSIAARNNNGIVTAYSTAVDTLTVPATPAGLAPTAVNTTSITLSWSGNGNPAWTKYELSYSTDNFSGDVRTAFSYADNHTATNGVVNGLLPNTTYQCRVRVFGDDGSAYRYTNMVSTITVSWAPNGLSWPDIGISSATVAWTDTTANPADSVYRVELSTWNGFTGTVLSSTTVKEAAGAFFSSLTPNTTYYGRVVARSWAGVETPAVIGSSMTFAITPAALALTAVNISSASLSWNANGNPSWTRYEVTYSSNNFVSNISTSASLASGLKALTTSVIALNPDTTFWFRIRAYNEDGIATGYATTVSSITLSQIPSLAGMQISSDSIRVTWGANGNPFWTQYVAENIVAGSSNPAQTPLFWQETGLTPNTTYQYRVKSVNSGGVSSSWAALWSTSTLAAMPPAPAVTGVVISSVNYRINVDVNPGWTEYGVRISSGNGGWVRYAWLDGTFSMTPVYASTTSWSASPWVKNLVPNTVYSLSVAARNNNGVLSNYSAVVDTLTIPSTPHSLAPAAVNATSITLSWNGNGNPAYTKYELSYSTDNFSGDVRTAFTYADNHTATNGVVNDLLPNTTYQYRVRVFGDDGSAYRYSNIASTVTVPSAPNGLAWSDIGVSSITIAWIDTTTNSGNSVYRVELSTWNGFTGAVLSSTTVKEATAASFASLTPNTTYYGRVVARSWVGAETPAVMGSCVTFAVAPTALALTAVHISSASLSWNANGNPSWTRYEVTCSTDGFISNVSTAIALGDTHTAVTGTATNLTANTTCWFRVRAFNSDGTAAAYANIVSSITLSNVPSFVDMQISSDSIRVTWGANGNPSWTRYVAENIIAGSSIPAQTPLFWQETGLIPNTTYQYRVKSVNSRGVSSSWATFWSTSTLAAVPPAPALSGVMISSFSYHINIDVNPDVNPVWTEFGVKISSDNGGWVQYARPDGTFGTTPVFASTTSWSASPWVTNLVPNTAYRLSVAARNSNGVVSNYSTHVDTLTVPATPFNLAPTAVNATSVTLLWNGNGNPAWTKYELSYSTDSFSSDVRTAFTYADNHTSTSGTAGGLIANTTYQFRARVFGEDGLAYGYTNIVSTITAPWAPNGLVWSDVGRSSITVVWNDTSLNPLDSTYRFELSPMANFSSAVVSSSTVKAAERAVISGLVPNTTYYGRVIACSFDGRQTAALLSPSGMVTFCIDPLDITVMTVNRSSVTVNWNANGNPAWTRYEITCSTDNFNVHQSVAGAFSDAIVVTTFTAQNLASNTTYYFRVRAINAASFTTAYTVVASTLTLAMPPNGLAWGTQYPMGLTMTWSDTTTNPDITVYRYELCGDAGFSGTILSSTTAKDAATALITGLAVNTTYYGRVIARSRDGRETTGTTASSLSRMTLGMTPDSIAITGVFISSIAVSWGANGNPAGTRYEITCSTDAFAAHVSIVTGIGDGFTGTALTASALVPNTTYYFRVRAANGESIPTAYSGVVSSITLPLAPNGIAWNTVAAHTITGVWVDTTANPGDSLYRYELCTAADFSGTVFSSTTVKNASAAIVSGLTANTTYFGRVVAISRNNVRAASLLVPSCVETLSESPASLEFTSVHFTSVTVSWMANGNPAGTRYEISLSTDSFTQYFSTPVTRADNLTAVSSNLTGLLPGTTYWFRIRAYSSLGQSSAYANMISTETRENYVSMSLNGTMVPDRAVDNNLDPSDGYEDYVSVVDTMTLRIDCDRDGKYDFLVSTADSALPEVYWDPDAHYFTHVIIGDVDNDGVPDYLLDTNNDGILDTYYNVARSSVMAYSAFVARDVDSNGISDYAYDNDLNITNGFEAYRSLTTTATVRTDGDRDGKYDFFISTGGSVDPEVYWDPDHTVFVPVALIDMNGDGVTDYIFDANGDGMPESVYDTATSSVTQCVTLTGTTIGLPGTFIVANGNPAQGYAAYVDPTGQTSSVFALDCDGDGKKDFFIDITRDGVPDRYADPDNGLLTTIAVRDYDGDGILDWGIDTTGNGTYNKYYRMPGGPLLSAFVITREQAYTISPNPFHSDREMAAIVYDMKDAGDVIIDIYDIAGEKVAVLVNGSRSNGRHQVRWNGGNGEFDAADGFTAGSGNKLAKGIYIMRFKLPSEQYLKKIAIIR